MGVAWSFNSIPLSKFLLNVILHRLVNRKIYQLQLVSAIWWQLHLCCRNIATTSVVCPRKTSNIVIAGCVDFNFKSFLLCDTKSTIIFLMFLLTVSSFAKQFSLCQISHPSGNETVGWHFSVFPLYNNWGFKYSPLAVTAGTAVSYLLSSMFAIGTTLAPHFSIVQSLVGTIDKPV